MQLRNLLSCLLIGVMFVLVIVPSVHAQTTSVTVLSSPSSVVLRSDGTAQFEITTQVTYAGLLQQVNQYEILVVGLSSSGLNLSPNGTAASKPDPCLPSAVSGLILKPGVTDCAILLVQGSGTETVSFHATIYNAVPQQYHFEVLAGFIAVTAQKNTVMEGSSSYAYFNFSIRNQVTITITAPNQIAVTIDNTIQNSGPVTVTVSPGKHTISVPQTVSLALGSRLMFDHWSDGSTLATRTVDLEDDTNLTLVYVTQYELTLTDPAATGSGWYDQGLVAGISIPSTEPCQGILAALGCTNNFQGWYENGNLIASTNSASITMTSPHTLDTQWTTNMTEPIAIIALIVVVIGATIAFAVKRSYGAHHKRRRSRK